MGEIAEMMMEGILCAGCGAYIDDSAPGYPRYCCKACEPQKKSAAKKGRLPGDFKAMRKADRQWLALAASPGSGMYPGSRWDMCPTAFNRLSKLGFVDRWEPHNPAHKPRAVATDAGRLALKRAGA